VDADGVLLGVRGEAALATGAGVVGVRNSNHFGAAAANTLRAAAAGMVGIALSHAEADVVPFGGRSPALGTNPLSIAVPGPDGAPPLILDMATSGVAMGPDVRRMYDDFSAPQALGHLVIVFDVTRFVPLEVFRAGVAAYTARLTAVTPVEGVDRVRLPGEVEAEAEQRNRRDGVPLSRALATALRGLGADVGRPFPEGAG
jgi:LDH2 family malate/lactate/ureidoglycolate dehydrogenase